MVVARFADDTNDILAMLISRLAALQMVVPLLLRMH